MREKYYFYNMETKKYYDIFGNMHKKPHCFSHICIIVPSYFLQIAYFTEHKDEDSLYAEAFKQLHLNIEEEYFFLPIHNKNIAYIYPKKFIIETINDLNNNFINQPIIIPDILCSIPFFEKIAKEKTCLFIWIDGMYNYLFIFHNRTLYFIQPINEIDNIQNILLSVYPILNFKGLTPVKGFLKDKNNDHLSIINFCKAHFNIDMEIINNSINIYQQETIDFIYSNIFYTLNRKLPYKYNFKNIKIICLISFLIFSILLYMPLNNLIQSYYELNKEHAREIVNENNNNFSINKDFLLEKIQKDFFSISEINNDYINKLYIINHIDSYYKKYIYINNILEEINNTIHTNNITINYLQFINNNDKKIIDMDIQTQNFLYIINFTEHFIKQQKYNIYIKEILNDNDYFIFKIRIII